MMPFCWYRPGATNSVANLMKWSSRLYDGAKDLCDCSAIAVRLQCTALEWCGPLLAALTCSETCSSYETHTGEISLKGCLSHEVTTRVFLPSTNGDAPRPDISINLAAEFSKISKFQSDWLTGTTRSESLKSYPNVCPQIESFNKGLPDCNQRVGRNALDLLNMIKFISFMILASILENIDKCLNTIRWITRLNLPPD